MLGKSTFEITISQNKSGEHNWDKASSMTKELVEEGYAVLTTIEEDLIVLNCVYASNCCEADRNYVAFMSADEYDENLFDDYEPADFSKLK